MRLLFTGPKYFEYLEIHAEMTRPRVIRALNNLRTHNDIKSKKIYLQQDKPVEISVPKIVAGIFGVDDFDDVKVSTYRPYTHLYNITKNQGVSKICFYEFYYGMHQLWTPPGIEGKYQRHYERAIAEVIENQAFFKKKKSLA